MAKEKGTTGSKSPPTSAKLGDIATAARSTMEPESYEQGYPENEGTQHNLGPLGNRSGKKEK